MQNHFLDSKNSINYFDIFRFLEVQGFDLQNRSFLTIVFSIYANFVSFDLDYLLAL